MKNHRRALTLRLLCGAALLAATPACNNPPPANAKTPDASDRGDAAGDHGTMPTSDAGGAGVVADGGGASEEGSTSTGEAGGDGVVVALAAAPQNFCGVLSNGTVECVGSDLENQLGNPNYKKNPHVPVPVLGLSGVKSVAIGGSATYALLNDGTVMSWGSNLEGQLGIGVNPGAMCPDSGALETPTPVPGLVPNLTGVVDISATSANACAVLSNGTVECWGSNVGTLLGPSAPDVCGTCIAIGSSSPCALSPLAISGITNAVSVAIESSSACALLRDGTVQCWGVDNSGQLGNGTTSPNLTYPAVAVPGVSGATAIASNGGHTCVIVGGQVLCWGANQSSSLGNEYSGPCPQCNQSPNAVVGVSKATALAAAPDHTCALLSDQTVVCWGGDNLGQLGNGTMTDNDTITPTPVTGLTGVTAIAADSGYTCALTNGHVMCWGGNGTGMFGSNNSTIIDTPMQIPF
jgi:alpha-tubulin suppressor-like RCC1 family protein